VCLRHERIAGEARVGGGVSHDEDIGLQDGVRAEGGPSRCGIDRNAYPRLKPLPIAGDEADQCDRRTAEMSRKRREIVERYLGRRIENVIPPERNEAG
jgi:hypothetical protein